MECKEFGSTILCQVSCHHICDLSKGEGTIFQQQQCYYIDKNKKKVDQVDQAHIIYNSLCSEVDWWYKYVKENKGDKKDTCQSALVLVNIFQYLFVHQKENPLNPLAKVKKTKEEMQTTLENRKKAATNSPKSVIKRMNKVEEGRTSSLLVKREHESIEVRAQK